MQLCSWMLVEGEQNIKETGGGKQSKLSFALLSTRRCFLQHSLWWADTSWWKWGWGCCRELSPEVLMELMLSLTCVTLVGHQMILQRGGGLLQSWFCIWWSIRTSAGWVGLDSYPVTCGISLKLEWNQKLSVSPCLLGKIGALWRAARTGWGVFFRGRALTGNVQMFRLLGLDSREGCHGAQSFQNVA